MEAGTPALAHPTLAQSSAGPPFLSLANVCLGASEIPFFGDRAAFDEFVRVARPYTYWLDG